MSNMFSKCVILSRVILPSTLTVIGDNAFFYCAYLEDIILPVSIIEIGASSFQGCTKFKGELNFPKLVLLGRSSFAGTAITRIRSLGKIKQIEQETFKNCKDLESVILPDTITFIAKYSFDNCSKLNSVVCMAAIPPEIEIYTFSGNLNFYVPDQSVTAYKTATNWNAFAGRIKPLSDYRG